jgi:hypothetical protein
MIEMHGTSGARRESDCLKLDDTALLGGSKVMSWNSTQGHRLMKCLLACCILVASPTPSIVHGDRPTTPIQAVRADTQEGNSADESNVSEKTKGRWRQFSSAHFEKTLNSPKDKVRNRAILDINQLYWDHPEVPGLLISAINEAVAAGEVPVSTLSMVQTLAQFHTPSVKQEQKNQTP